MVFRVPAGTLEVDRSADDDLFDWPVQMRLGIAFDVQHHRCDHADESFSDLNVETRRAKKTLGALHKVAVVGFSQMRGKRRVAESKSGRIA